MVHAGFDINDQKVRSEDGVRVYDMPVLDVASLVYRGSMDNVGPTYEAPTRWIDDNGYRLLGRSRESWGACIITTDRSYLSRRLRPAM